MFVLPLTAAAAEDAAVCGEEGVLPNVLDVAGQQLAQHHSSRPSQRVTKLLAGRRRRQIQLWLVLGLQDCRMTSSRGAG
jgi:hypothetical protein